MAEKILVVDDEDIIRESLTYILTKEKYEVAEAANGKIASEMLKETSYDLVITDIEMPVMKGLELLDEIKNLHIAESHIEYVHMLHKLLAVFWTAGNICNEVGCHQIHEGGRVLGNKSLEEMARKVFTLSGCHRESLIILRKHA